MLPARCRFRPMIANIWASGATALPAIAAELNARGIVTAGEDDGISLRSESAGATGCVSFALGPRSCFFQRSNAPGAAPPQAGPRNRFCSRRLGDGV